MAKSRQEYSSDAHCLRVESGRELFWLQTLRSWENWTRQKSTLEGSLQRESRLRRVKISHSQSQTARQNCLEEIMEFEIQL